MFNIFSANASAPVLEQTQHARASSSNDVFRGTSSATAALLSPWDEKQPSNLGHPQQLSQMLQAPQLSPRPQKPLPVLPSPRLQQSDTATIGIDLR
jgi:hypothetical protein